MSSFNYGIDCENESNAQDIYDYIEKLDIFQDGLDISENRVSIISSQALLSEIKKFSAKQGFSLSIEVWPVGIEYDEAESSNQLEITVIEPKKSKKLDAPKISKFKAYSGKSVNIENFKKWLIGLNVDGLDVIGSWEPENEYGSYGIEFVCNEPKFDKLADKEWMSKGVITEKMKIK